MSLSTKKRNFRLSVFLKVSFLWYLTVFFDVNHCLHSWLFSPDNQSTFDPVSHRLRSQSRVLRNRWADTSSYSHKLMSPGRDVCSCCTLIQPNALTKLCLPERNSIYFMNSKTESEGVSQTCNVWVCSPKFFFQHHNCYKTKQFEDLMTHNTGKVSSQSLIISFSLVSFSEVDFFNWASASWYCLSFFSV